MLWFKIVLTVLLGEHVLSFLVESIKDDELSIPYISIFLIVGIWVWL